MTSRLGARSIMTGTSLRRRAAWLAVFASLTLACGPAVGADGRRPGDIIVTGIIISGDQRFALIDSGRGARKRGPGETVGDLPVLSRDPGPAEDEGTDQDRCCPQHHWICSNLMVGYPESPVAV